MVPDLLKYKALLHRAIFLLISICLLFSQVICFIYCLKPSGENRSKIGQNRAKLDKKDQKQVKTCTFSSEDTKKVISHP